MKSDGNAPAAGNATLLDQANSRTQEADARTANAVSQGEELRTSEVSYRRLFESARDGILILNANSGHIIDANPFLVELLGFSRRELLGKTVGEISPFKDLVANRAMLERLQEHGYVRYEDLPLETKDGRRIDVEFVSNVYQAGDQKVAQCNVRDITERKRSEAALRGARHLTEEIINALPVRVFWKDLNLVYLGCNAEFAQDAGFADPKDIIGKDDYQMGWREQAEVYRAGDRQVIDSGCTKLLLEETLTTPAGKTISLLTNKTPLRGTNREIIGVLGTYMDVTERKRAEAAHDRLAMVAEQSKESVVITDAQGTIVYVNPAFEANSGYTHAECLGQNPRILKSGQHDRAFYSRMWEVLQRGERWSGHLTNRRKDGGLYEEEASITPLRNAEGSIINYVAVKRNVTRELQLEAQSIQAQKMESIGQLAGGIAHDFNNMLAAIMMQTELSSTVEGTPQDVQDGLAQILAAAKRAAALTRQLLLFSRRQIMQSRQLDLNELVTSLAKMLRRVLREDVSLELRLGSGALLVCGDAGMLDQVLMNLVVNARDAMSHGGRIIIETAEKVIDAERAALNLEASPGRFVWLSVSDTGCGIPKEIRSRIFEPFFTTKEAGKGTGLGLASVFGIVKQHAGWLNVYSEVGEGTTFQVFLPACEASAATPLPVERAKPKPRGGSETILLAEDDTPVRMATRLLLERYGYHVLEAADGVEAQRIWAEATPGRIDLLLTDIIMPGGVDGRELAARFQAQRPSLKVIFCSGYSAEIAGRELVLQTGQNFIQKPCPSNQLLETVRSSLDQEN